MSKLTETARGSLRALGAVSAARFFTRGAAVLSLYCMQTQRFRRHRRLSVAQWVECAYQRMSHAWRTVRGAGTTPTPPAETVPTTRTLPRVVTHINKTSTRLVPPESMKNAQNRASAQAANGSNSPELIIPARRKSPRTPLRLGTPGAPRAHAARACGARKSSNCLGII